METTLNRVKNVVAAALYLDTDEVIADANLMHDLGAESIDFLDIMFRLENEFGIKLPKGEIERQSRGNLTDAEFAVDGKLTAQALARLAEIMPEVDPSRLRDGLLVREIPSLFSVQTFVRMVEHQLDAGKTADRGLVAGAASASASAEA